MTVDEALHDVWIRGLPVPLQARMEERQEELLREFAHIAHSSGEAHIPQRLLALVAEARSRYGTFAGEVRTQILEARAAGLEEIDLRYRVPGSVAEVAERLLRSFDEADQFCRSGDLLTLAPPPDLLRFRTWFLREFLRQLEGAEPQPWSAVGAVAPDPADESTQR